MKGHVTFSALDEFKIQELAMRIELGDKSVVISGLRITVDARNEIALFEGIIHKAIGRLEFRHGDLGAERANERNGYDPDEPGRRKADNACQKGHLRGSSAHKLHGC